jgi:uncharacterized protein (DUF305 family)
MKRIRIGGIGAAVAAAIALSACAGASSASRQSTTPMTREQSIAAAKAKARADSAKLPYTEADINFINGMIGHHAQAIVMAKWAPTHGASSAIQVLCARIINAQSDEINLMQQWLRERNQPVTEPNPKGMTMVMNGETHVMAMPGMLTEEQLKQLDASNGKEFDRLFLTFMIQHHQGAVGMVKDLFATAGAGQDEMIFKLASDVNVDQTTEIARMQKMLFTLLTQSPSH